MAKKKALIIGVTGQDGSYLADYLLSKKYIVFGLKRRSSTFNTSRIDHLYKKDILNKSFIPYYGDLTDTSSLIRVIQRTKPDEIYNLGAQSHVHTSFETPEYTANSDALGALRVLEAIRILGLKNKTKYYQASTSEIFGNTQIPQNENSPFKPQSPYAISKLYAYWTTINYREAYNIFAVNGILFNHEGPRRGETFVSRKITRHVAKYFFENKEILFLGNLYSKRDWGSAKDYIKTMWLMLQQKKPSDYVIATGKSYTVKKFVEESFNCINITIKWKNKGLKEIGYDKNNNNTLVKIDKGYYRPTEVHELRGDSSKAKKELGWKPKVAFKDLVKEMIDADIKKLEKNRV
jgi:GDPmannose 4,6-dehydratase